MVLPTPPLAVKTVMILPSTVGPLRSVVVAARMRHDTSRDRRQAAASAAWSPVCITSRMPDCSAWFSSSTLGLIAHQDHADRRADHPQRRREPQRLLGPGPRPDHHQVLGRVAVQQLGRRTEVVGGAYLTAEIRKQFSGVRGRLAEDGHGLSPHFRL